jgi:hypothetical protein
MSILLDYIFHGKSTAAKFFEEDNRFEIRTSLANTGVKIDLPEYVG